MGWHDQIRDQTWFTGTPHFGNLAELVCGVVDSGVDRIIHAIHESREIILSNQSIIDTDVQALAAITQELVTGAANIQAEIATLQAAGVDTTGLQSAMAPLQAAADAIAAIAPSAAPAPVDTVPAPDQPAPTNPDGSPAV